jgi:hypothetical protein
MTGRRLIAALEPPGRVRPHLLLGLPATPASLMA